MKYLIKKGRLVDPANRIDKILDILIEDGKIKAIDQEIEIEKAIIIDASNKIVTPGLIDMHVHLREPGREDEETIESGSRAAIKGGFTAITSMPNTDPPVDNASIVEMILEKASRVGLARVFPVGAITKGLKGEEISEMADLIQAGVVAFSDDGNSVMNALVMRRAMEYAKMFNVPLILHEEDKNLSRHGQANEGFYSTLLGLKGIPAVAEEVMVARDLLLAKFTGAKIHIAHVSTKGSVALIAQAKNEGVKVTCEVTPHHLILTHDNLMDFDTNLKINPPLRSREDVESLREGLKDGTIDAIASDHAPHARQEKEVEFDLASFGMVGLETSLPLLITELVDKGVISFPCLIEKLSANPAKILGVPGGKLSPGSSVDLVIIDPEEKFEVKVEKFESKSHNSPFNGWKLKGLVKHVFSQGKLAFFEGAFLELKEEQVFREGAKKKVTL